MKVLNVKVLTKHNVSESWGGARERFAQALTGGHAGCVLSRVIPVRGADAVKEVGKPYRASHFGEACPNPARSETTCMYVSTMCGSREILPLCLPCVGRERVTNSKEVRS
jgi:hypothetical protein